MALTHRLIDWVNVTLQEYTDISDVLALFPVEFSGCARGFLGYKGQLACEGNWIRVLYDGSEGMGIHVQITGEGCRLLESLEPGVTWADRFRRFEALGASYARCDLALDSFTADHTTEVVAAHVAARSVTTRWARTPVRETRGTMLGDGSKKGHTIYFGSDKSEARLRVYDKRAEVTELELAAAGHPEHWTRFEFQFRNERADRIVALIAEGREDDAVGVCRSYIEFREYCLDSNKSMAPVASWWADLCNASKLILRLFDRAAMAIEKVDAWIDRQVATALAVLVAREGGDITGALHRYIESGRRRLKGRHYRMIGPPIGAFG